MARRWKVFAAILVVVVLYGLAVTVSEAHRRAARSGGASVSSHAPSVLRGPGPRNRLTPNTPDTTDTAIGPGASGVGDSLPAGVWSLPRPTRYEGVAGVGYPETTLGAVALGYSALVARFTTDPDIAVSVVRATVMGPTPTFLESVAQGTQSLRTRFGLAPTGPTPTTIGLSVIACRVASASPTRVVAGYEGTLSIEGGSVQGTTADVSVAIVLMWDGGDWKIDPGVSLPTPPIDFPTSSGTTIPDGWHVCTET